MIYLFCDSRVINTPNIYDSTKKRLISSYSAQKTPPPVVTSENNKYFYNIDKIYIDTITKEQLDDFVKNFKDYDTIIIQYYVKPNGFVLDYYDIAYDEFSLSLINYHLYKNFNKFMKINFVAYTLENEDDDALIVSNIIVNDLILDSPILPGEDIKAMIMINNSDMLGNFYSIYSNNIVYTTDVNFSNPVDLEFGRCDFSNLKEIKISTLTGYVSSFRGNTKLEKFIYNDEIFDKNNLISLASKLPNVYFNLNQFNYSIGSDRNMNARCYPQYFNDIFKNNVVTDTVNIENLDKENVFLNYSKFYINVPSIGDMLTASLKMENLISNIDLYVPFTTIFTQLLYIEHNMFLPQVVFDFSNSNDITAEEYYSHYDEKEVRSTIIDESVHPTSFSPVVFIKNSQNFFNTPNSINKVFFSILDEIHKVHNIKYIKNENELYDYISKENLEISSGDSNFIVKFTY